MVHSNTKRHSLQSYKISSKNNNQATTINRLVKTASHCFKLERKAKSRTSSIKFADGQSQTGRNDTGKGRDDEDNGHDNQHLRQANLSDIHIAHSVR